MSCDTGRDVCRPSSKTIWQHLELIRSKLRVIYQTACGPVGMRQVSPLWPKQKKGWGCKGEGRVRGLLIN